MSRPPIRLRCAALVIALLAGAGCGSGHSSGQSPIDPSFRVRATKVCGRALAAKRAQGPFPFPSFNPTKPDPSRLPAVGRFEARTVVIYRRWLSEMQALGEPPKGATDWNGVVAALHDNLGTIAEQQRAGIDSDAKTFTKDYFRGNAIQKNLEDRSTAAGLKACEEAAAG